MFGKAVYVSDYVKNGLNGIKNGELCFTSFHIQEEFNDEFKDNAIRLLKDLNALNAKIMVDISRRTLDMLSVSNVKELCEKYHVSIVRFDFGFSEEEIIEASKYVAVAINASTNDFQLARKLNKEVYAVHNFYPRCETGLDEEFFVKRNKILREEGIKILGFIPGDKRCRGPIYEGVPTLESHRYVKPYAAYLDLVINHQLDGVMVGDFEASEYDLSLINNYENNKIIDVPCVLNEVYSSLYDMVFTSREDSPKSLIRFKESREYATFGNVIKPCDTLVRNRGSITIDNEKYLRYSGEIQITRQDFEMNEKINVIGSVLPEYIKVIDMIENGCKFRLVRGKVC